jgi:hypothetical protein
LETGQAHYQALTGIPTVSRLWQKPDSYRKFFFLPRAMFFLPAIRFLLPPEIQAPNSFSTRTQAYATRIPGVVETMYSITNKMQNRALQVFGGCLETPTITGPDAPKLANLALFD